MNQTLIPTRPANIELVDREPLNQGPLFVPGRLTVADRWRFSGDSCHAVSVIKALKMKETLTPHGAKEAFGCFRLASVYKRINDEGVYQLENIQRELKVNYGVYRIKK